MTTSHRTGRSQGDRRWTAADDKRLIELHGDEMTLNGCAREMGFTSSIVSDHAKKLGLSWDRSRVEQANINNAALGKARRQAIVEKLYQRAEGRIDALNTGKWKKLTKGSFGVESTEELDFVPADDERHIASSVTSYLTGAAKLEALDADNGNQLGRSLLEGLAAAFGIGPVDHGEDVADDPA